MMAHNLSKSLTRLAQMEAVAANELIKQRDSFRAMVKRQEEIFDFMDTQMIEIRKGIDDAAILVGIIPEATWDTRGDNPLYVPPEPTGL